MLNSKFSMPIKVNLFFAKFWLALFFTLRYKNIFWKEGEFYGLSMAAESIMIKQDLIKLSNVIEVSGNNAQIDFDFIDNLTWQIKTSENK